MSNFETELDEYRRPDGTIDEEALPTSLRRKLSESRDPLSTVLGPDQLDRISDRLYSRLEPYIKGERDEQLNL